MPLLFYDLTLADHLPLLVRKPDEIHARRASEIEILSVLSASFINCPMILYALIFIGPVPVTKISPVVGLGTIVTAGLFFIVFMPVPTTVKGADVAEQPLVSVTLPRKRRLRWE